MAIYMWVSDGTYQTDEGVTVPAGERVMKIEYVPPTPYQPPSGISLVIDDGQPVWQPPQ